MSAQGVPALAVPAAQVLRQFRLGRDAPATMATIPLDLPPDYAHMQVRLSGRTTLAGTGSAIHVRCNQDSGNNYDWQQLYGVGAGIGASETIATAQAFVGYFAGGTAPAGVASSIDLWIANYGGREFYKAMAGRGSYHNGLVSGSHLAVLAASLWRSTGPIQRLDFLCGSGEAFDTGALVTLIGWR